MGEEGCKDQAAEWRFMDQFWFNVTFIYHNKDAEIKTVCLVGDFCGWRSGEHVMQRCDEGFTVSLLLGEGFYNYKFNVDGNYITDEHNPHISVNYGNSVMFVHMDPSVYGYRPEYPPHRDYRRWGSSDGSEFQILRPKISEELAKVGLLERQIYVYLPPSYSSSPQKKFPVVYFNDGQNIFSTPQDKGGPNGGGWYLDEKLDKFWSQGDLPEFIAVAIPNSDFVCPGNRVREYCTRDFLNTSNDDYIKYVINCVKVDIDSKYHTLSDRANTYILGASMGGLQALVTALNHSDVFTAAACISPSLWYVDCNNHTAFDLVRAATGRPSEPAIPSRLYIDCGDCVSDNRHVVKQMDECLQDCGWKVGRDYMYLKETARGDTDMHAEWVWRERALGALQFLLLKSDSKS